MSASSEVGMSDYEVLISAGHSPFKAAEIALDVKRGDRYAKEWVTGLRANLAANQAPGKN